MINDQPVPILFVVNPYAGTNKKMALAEMLERYIDRRKYTPQIVYTERIKHAQEFAAQAVEENIPYLVAVGGDGTVNECASGVVSTNTSLGIVPLGSGNGLARDLGIPLEVTSALSLLNNHKLDCIDCGQVGSDYFFCTAGVGFDAYVSKKFAGSSQRGLVGYLRSIAEEFLHYKSQHYTLLSEGNEELYKAFSITFANAAQFGNNAVISPMADIRDGKLDICIVKDYPKHLGLSMGLRLFNRSIHKSRYVKISKVQDVVIKCPKGTLYHLDGEVKQSEENTLHVSILPSSLKVMVATDRESETNISLL